MCPLPLLPVRFFQTHSGESHTTCQQCSAPAWSLSPAHVSRYPPERARCSVSQQRAVRGGRGGRSSARAALGRRSPQHHPSLCGGSSWQKWSTPTQPRPLPQLGASVFGTLCEALLGLEGKIAPEEAVTGENLAGHRHCVADGSSCPCPAAVRPVMWCQQGQQPQPSFSVMVPPG